MCHQKFSGDFPSKPFLAPPHPSKLNAGLNAIPWRPCLGDGRKVTIIHLSGAPYRWVGPQQLLQKNVLYSTHSFLRGGVGGVGPKILN